MEKTGNNGPPQKGDIFWVSLDPTIGAEITKTRPCVIVSNNIANQYSSRVIVAPITSNATEIRSFEVPISVKGKKCKILLDQIRSIDKIRLGKRIDSCEYEMIEYINDALRVVFALN